MWTDATQQMDLEVGRWEPLIFAKMPVHAAVPTSEFVGVYQCETQKYLSLHKPAQSVRGSGWSYFEVESFLRKALFCDPDALDLIFSSNENFIIITEVGRSLISIAPAFLSTESVRHSYRLPAGGIISAIETFLRDGYKWKTNPDRAKILTAAQQAVARLREGYQLLTTGTLVTQMEDLSFLWDPEDLSAKKMLKFVRKELQRVNEAKSVLPDAPDSNAVSDWLVSARLAQVDLDKDLSQQLNNAKDLIRTIYRQLGSSSFQFGAKAVEQANLMRQIQDETDLPHSG